ncbi:MAG: DUF1553 domain-containing protein [Planctomycetales bacterium]|nr:DUF1553 domain-containing protein [Planctomycetales bacterium]
MPIHYSLVSLVLIGLFASTPHVSRGDEKLEPTTILAQHCVRCHHDAKAEGGLSLTTREKLLTGGDSGAVVDLSSPGSSYLLELITGDPPEMPQGGPPLSAEAQTALRRWIEQGLPWPEQLILSPTPEQWWSLTPLAATPLPSDTASDPWVRTPIDAFILAGHQQHDLHHSPPADRRTLIRRLYYDLTGLPPTPAQVQQFEQDTTADAYEQLVDRLLDSPQYGERWARHWLDVVHYGDTHGYDKDKPRPNAWPYRDYVIRSLNADKPYEQFVREQLAGDALWPSSPEALVATGFIAAGPWDFIGHAEVPETKIDGQVARNLDRDDMVTSTVNTFLSTTVQCARCHDHKFDPITQRQYYGLQAVFAALDRADRAYDPDPRVAARRQQLTESMAEIEARLKAVETALADEGQYDLSSALAALRSGQDATRVRPEAYGYHSQVAAEADAEKWVQVDLGQGYSLSEIQLHACDDDFNQIGAGFGFPRRYRVTASNDPQFEQDVAVIADRSREPQPNPGLEPVVISVDHVTARYVRITASELAPRQDDYIMAIAELTVYDDSHRNVSRQQAVTALDSIEAPVRWQRANLVDGQYPHKGNSADEVAVYLQQSDESGAARRSLVAASLEQLNDQRKQLAQLPTQQHVYVGTVHTGQGTFRGTGHNGGRPREIHVLHRGEVTAPGDLVGPGTLDLIPNADWQFRLPDDASEADRRIALADWIVRPDNPLTWRSIVNRVWQYHFGKGIVDTPNDFGRMGATPTNPELLDWLAAWFRDNGQSLKDLHRLIVTSNTYRQSSAFDEAQASRDGDNRFLWRMNRRALDAEAIRDTILLTSGQLDPTMYGPGFQDFVVEHPEHSPHYEYHLHDPADARTHRRSIYRFLVRSQQQPFMQTLDCADPSQSIAQRDTTLTAVQALTMLNNRFVLYAAEQFAAKLTATHAELDEQLRAAVSTTLGREPAPQELEALRNYTQTNGLPNTCRLLFNLNEFSFVD